MKSCDEAPKLERKTVEKNRRIHMKNLIFKLSSLIPKDQRFSKDTSQHEYLDYTASYIKHMKARIERLKQREAGTGDQINNQEKLSGIELPLLEVRQRDSSLRKEPRLSIPASRLLVTRSFKPSTARSSAPQLAWMLQMYTGDSKNLLLEHESASY